MSQKILVYWIGVIGVPGKGPAYIAPYNPNQTIGELISLLQKSGLGERNKRIEIFKHQPGNMSKYDVNAPHWHHNTKLSDYLSQMGGWYGSKELVLAYCIV